jgi:Zn-finger domain associated with topoisomerase type I
MSEQLFSRHGGYRRLDSFMISSIIYYSTVEFCREHGMKGRQQEQMVQAARSGRQNIAEGSERASTSAETEIKLVDVARASLIELQLDYEDYINLSGGHPWPDDSQEAKDVWNVRLARLESEKYDAHNFSKLVAENRKRFAKWLKSDDPMTIANALVRLCERADLLLHRQLDSLGERFVEEGGFREKMTRVRLSARDEHQSESAEKQEEAPKCPACGKPMRKREAKADGKPFWGCSGYPECRGTREYR